MCNGDIFLFISIYSISLLPVSSSQFWQELHGIWIRHDILNNVTSIFFQCLSDRYLEYILLKWPSLKKCVAHKVYNWGVFLLCRFCVLGLKTYAIIFKQGQTPTIKKWCWKTITHSLYLHLHSFTVWVHNLCSHFRYVKCGIQTFPLRYMNSFIYKCSMSCANIPVYL